MYNAKAIVLKKTVMIAFDNELVKLTTKVFFVFFPCNIVLFTKYPKMKKLSKRRGVL